MTMLSLFCKVDDFCIFFEQAVESQHIEQNGTTKRRPRTLALSEVMTIVILFHMQGYRNFKHFYCQKICKYHQREFPKRVSYNHFARLMSDALLPLTLFLKTRCMGLCYGLSFIDSSSIRVCNMCR